MPRSVGDDVTGHRPVVDPDVDLHDPNQREETVPREWDLLLAIAAGAASGALARYALEVALPHAGDGFPWSTLLINVTGCLAIGVLMVIVLERAPRRLLRPFVGTGVLGGYTTYSTFAIDVERLLVDHRPAVAAAYVGLTLAACLIAVCAGTWLTRAVVVRLRDWVTA